MSDWKPMLRSKNVLMSPCWNASKWLQLGPFFWFYWFIVLLTTEAMSCCHAVFPHRHQSQTRALGRFCSRWEWKMEKTSPSHTSGTSSRPWPATSMVCWVTKKCPSVDVCYCETLLRHRKLPPQCLLSSDDMFFYQYFDRCHLTPIQVMTYHPLNTFHSCNANAMPCYDYLP